MVKEAQTLAQIVTELEHQGYTAAFKAEGGKLILLPDHVAIMPASVEVKAVRRLEGETDLDEETIVFALFAPAQNVSGIYVAAFGPKMTSEDAQVVQKLREMTP